MCGRGLLAEECGGTKRIIAIMLFRIINMTGARSQAHTHMKWGSTGTVARDPRHLIMPPCLVLGS